MSKLYKWLALIFGVLALFVLGLVLFVKFYLTAELLAAWITPPLEHYLHRQVSLSDARVGLRGFRVEGLEIRKPGADRPLLKGERLELRWKFGSLLGGRIEIQTLKFAKPELTLIRQEDGSLNIADLLPRKESPEPQVSPGTKVEPRPAGLALVISLLTMEDGRLTLLDRSRQPQSTLHLSNVQSTISDITTTAPVPFLVEAQIEDGSKGSLAINGTISLPTTSFRGDVKLKEIDLTHLIPFITVKNPPVVQQGVLSMDGSLKSEGFDRFEGQGSLSLTGLRIKTDQTLSKTLEIDAGFQLKADRAKQILAIGNLDLVLNGQKAQFHGVFNQWHLGPKLQFTMTSPKIALDELLALLPATPPPSGPGETAPEKSPEEAPSAAEPSPESGTGSTSVKQGTDQVPASNEKVEKPQAAPQEPSTPKESKETVAEAQSTAEGTPAEPVPTAAESKPKAAPLEVQGEIHLDWFFYNKFVASNVDCQLKFKDGVLQVEPLSSTVYGGALFGSVKTDVGLPGPPFHCRISSENVLLDEIVQAFAPGSPGKWAGNVNQVSRASGIGSDLGVLQSRTDLNINEVEFSGHPLTQKLAELFQADDLQGLRFSQVTARLLTNKGVATLKSLHLVGPVVQAEGSGTFGLLDKKLDMRLLLQIRKQYVGKIAPLRELVPIISDDQGFVQLPVNLSGTIDSPSYGLDANWLSKKTKEAAKKPLKKLEKKVLPKVPLSEKDKKKVKESLEKLIQ
jgi:AsmA protein